MLTFCVWHWVIRDFFLDIEWDLHMELHEIFQKIVFRHGGGPTHKGIGTYFRFFSLSKSPKLISICIFVQMVPKQES